MAKVDTAPVSNTAFGQSTIPLDSNPPFNHEVPLPNYHTLTAQEQTELRNSDRDIFADDYDAPAPPPAYVDSNGGKPSEAPVNLQEKDPSWLVPPQEDSIYGDVPGRMSTGSSPRSPVPSILSVGAESGTFVPGKLLKIACAGIPMMRLPFRYSEIEIPIHNGDNTPAYMSLRETPYAGNSVLMRSAGVGPTGEVDAKLVATTEYAFGPSTDPVVRCMPMGSAGFAPAAPHVAATEWRQVWEQGKQGVEVPVTGKWTRKTYGFTSPEGSVFEWRYVREKDAEGTKRITLALFLLPGRSSYDDKSEKKGKGFEGVRLAQLVRTEETRPAGATKRTAGNGGHLIMHRDVEKYTTEELVVATCLVMLKKEVDRRRMVQFMMLGAVGGIIL